MALTRYPAFGPDQPGMVELGIESTMATLSSSMNFIRTTDNIGGIEAIHRLMIEDEHLRQDLNKLAQIPGYEDADGYFVLPEGTTITVKHQLAGFSPTIPIAAAAYTDAAVLTTGYPLIQSVYGVLGGIVTQAVLDPLDAGSAVNSLVMTDATGVLVGGMLTVDVAAALGDPDYESGWVLTDGASETITLRVDLSAAAVEDNSVYGSVVAYAKSYLTDSWSLRWTGSKVAATTPLRLSLVGCVASQAVIEVPAFGIPTIEITYMVTAAMWDDASATGVSPQTWTYAAPEQAIGHRVQYIPGMVHDAAVDLCSTSLNITIDNGLQQLGCLGSEFGVYTYVKTAQNINIDMHAPYTAALRQAHSAQTAVGIEAELGSQPGKRIGLSFPGLVIETFSGPVSEGGVAYCDVTFRGTSYDGDTGVGSDDDSIDKAAYIAFG